MTRLVGEESSKSYEAKLASGFFTKYMSGNGLEIGGTGYLPNRVAILDTAINIELGFPGYDGVVLPFENESQDFVYSSHCLEHIYDSASVVREWYRVVKVGGHIVIVVPHQYLYEKKQFLPSKFNGDHKSFYTPGSLISSIETFLEPNSYRVEMLKDEAEGFDYTLGPEKHSGGQYEITLVLKKIKKPEWKLA